MENKTVTVDLQSLNKALRDGAKAAQAEAQAGAKEFAADTGMSPQSFLGIPGTGEGSGVDDIIDNVCDLRPQIKRLIKFAAWIPVLNGIVAKIKPYLDWSDENILKPLCKAAQDEKEAAGGGAQPATVVKKNFQG